MVIYIAVRVSQTTLNTCLAPRYPYQRFTHAPLSFMVPQTLFMFCRAAECPPFGAILPCHFISDSISSALVLLKGGEALVASSVCLVIYWCRVQACGSSLLQPVVWTGVARTGLSSCELNSSGAPRVCVCANFHGFSGPNVDTSEQERCPYGKAYVWHTLKSPACTHMQKHLNMLNERCVSVRYVGED